METMATPGVSLCLVWTARRASERAAAEQQPCSQCQLLKKQLEKELQHTARLQKEVRSTHPHVCCPLSLSIL